MKKHLLKVNAVIYAAPDPNAPYKNRQMMYTGKFVTKAQHNPVASCKKAAKQKIGFLPNVSASEPQIKAANRTPSM